MDESEAIGISKDGLKHRLPEWPVVVFGLSHKIRPWRDFAFYRPSDVTNMEVGDPTSTTTGCDGNLGAEQAREFRVFLEQFVALPQPGSLEFVDTLQHFVVKTAHHEATGVTGVYLVVSENDAFLSVRKTLFFLNFPTFPLEETGLRWQCLVRRCHAERHDSVDNADLGEIGWKAVGRLQEWVRTDDKKK